MNQVEKRSAIFACVNKKIPFRESYARKKKHFSAWSAKTMVCHFLPVSWVKIFPYFILCYVVLYTTNIYESEAISVRNIYIFLTISRSTPRCDNNELHSHEILVAKVSNAACSHRVVANFSLRLNEYNIRVYTIYNKQCTTYFLLENYVRTAFRQVYASSMVARHFNFLISLLLYTLYQNNKNYKNNNNSE